LLLLYCVFAASQWRMFFGGNNAVFAQFWRNLCSLDVVVM